MIEAMLHNGKEIKCKVDLSTVSVTTHRSLPVALFTTDKLYCPRCKKNTFVLFKEKYRHICFCIEGRCLSLDKEAAIAENTKRKESQEERNKRGIVTTGAEKYGLGRVYHDAQLSKWIASDEQHQEVLSWLRNSSPFLVVLGAPGTGKTYLAAALVNYLFEKNEEIAYLTHRRFIEEIHHAMQDGKTQHSIMPKYDDKNYLVLDDLGSATCTDWQQEMILELIDRRYSNKLKTIITSNFTKEQTKQKLGERTASRMFDKSNKILEFWSTDRRTTPKSDETLD